MTAMLTLAQVRRRVDRALCSGRTAHGGVPFDQKDVWRRGYDKARRQVLRELDAIESEEQLSIVAWVRAAVARRPWWVPGDPS